MLNHEGHKKHKGRINAEVTKLLSNMLILRVLCSFALARFSVFCVLRGSIYSIFVRLFT